MRFCAVGVESTSGTSALSTTASTCCQKYLIAFHEQALHHHFSINFSSHTHEIKGSLCGSFLLCLSFSFSWCSNRVVTFGSASRSIGAQDVRYLFFMSRIELFTDSNQQRFESSFFNRLVLFCFIHFRRLFFLFKGVQRFSVALTHGSTWLIL